MGEGPISPPPTRGRWDADEGDERDDGVAGLLGAPRSPQRPADFGPAPGAAGAGPGVRPASRPDPRAAGDVSRERGGRSPRRTDSGRRSLGLLASVLLVVVLLIAGVIGGGVYIGNRVFGGSTVADYSGPGSGSVTVQVHAGDGPDAIGVTLASLDVVKSSAAFAKAASADPRSASVAPGYYALRSHMSGAAALALLLTPSSALRSKVTVPEGSSLARTLALLAAHTSVKAADLAAAVANPAALGLPTYANGRVEGFLFPATYQVEPGTQAVDALTMFTQAFKVEAETVSLEAGAKALGLTPYQVVTVASLIEGEAAKAADRPQVAEVIYNRLKAGMNLGLESTVRYACVLQHCRTGGARVLASQLTTAGPSPYDTYTHSGLPPGPIDNPGGDALNAALHPAIGNNRYFVTLPKTNETVFTSSVATFNQLTAQCQAQGGC